MDVCVSQMSFLYYVSTQDEIIRFTESEWNVLISGGTLLRTMGSDVFHRVIHCVLSAVGVQRGEQVQGTGLNFHYGTSVR